MDYIDPITIIAMAINISIIMAILSINILMVLVLSVSILPPSNILHVYSKRILEYILYTLPRLFLQHFSRKNT